MMSAPPRTLLMARDWSAVSVSVKLFFAPANPVTQCDQANRQLAKNTCCGEGAATTCNVPPTSRSVPLLHEGGVQKGYSSKRELRAGDNLKSCPVLTGCPTCRCPPTCSPLAAVQRGRPSGGMAMASSRHFCRAVPEKTVALAGQHRTEVKFQGPGGLTTSRSLAFWAPLHRLRFHRIHPTKKPMESVAAFAPQIASNGRREGNDRHDRKKRAAAWQCLAFGQAAGISDPQAAPDPCRIVSEEVRGFRPHAFAIQSSDRAGEAWNRRPDHARGRSHARSHHHDRRA